MAAEEEAAEGGKNFLMHKIGPLPIIVWAVAIGVIYYVVVKKKTPGGSTAAGQTDPAGNVGSINPATGYVYGSPQDTSALGEQSSTGDSGSTSGSGGSTVAGQYSDNNSWARAAINLLVGMGVDPTEANSAIEQYIGGQPLTTAQQGEVNLAIQSIGAPPQPPAPGTSPSPIVTPPSPGTVYASNPPTGFTVTDKTSTSLSLNWNSSANASGYTVSYNTGGQSPQTTTVSGTATSTTITGLSPGSLYNVQVQATPAKTSDGFASLSTTTPGSATSSGGGSGPAAAKTVTVTAADAAAGPSGALKLIAARLGHPGSEVSLYDANKSAIDAYATSLGGEASQNVERTGYGQVHHLTGEWFPVKSGMVLSYPAGW
jgi:fibronectin type III domain protein